MKNVEARRQPYKDLAFFADAMLGSLARKLRIFGMDTAYSSSISDETLLEDCVEQKRILLTSDKELFERSLKKRIGGVLLHDHSDKENIVEILGRYKIREIQFDSASARCPTCNIKLKGVVKGELTNDQANLIPPKSYLLCSQFFDCGKCKKIYWEGSHKPGLVSLAESITRELCRIY